jgi:hypothetical protein
MTHGPQPSNDPTHHAAPGWAPQQPYPAPTFGSGWPGGPVPSPVEPAKGVWLAIVAVVLGALGIVLPFAPVALDGVRGYLALAFGLPGLVASILGCTGRRRGKAVAAVGVNLSVIALVIATIMLVNGA